VLGAVALLGAGGADSARLTVCSSSCRYATIPAALAVASNGDTIALTKSPVTANAASGAELYGSSGGGIYNHSSGALTLFKSPVTGNTPDDCIGC